MPGTYGVSETQPADISTGSTRPARVGGTAHNPGDLIDGIPLASGQSGLNYDFGELLPASVSGYVYVDANNNGVFDRGRNAHRRRTVTLLDASGKPTGATAMTDSSGLLSVRQLDARHVWRLRRPSRADIWTGSTRPAPWAARPTTPAT